MGFFEKIKQGLSKTASTIGGVFTGFSELDDEFYDELEESLILADLGVETAAKAVVTLKQQVKEQRLKTVEDAKAALRRVLEQMVTVGDCPSKSFHKALYGTCHRRQRRWQDDDHRQALQPADPAGKKGPAVRRRHLPRRRC